VSNWTMWVVENCSLITNGRAAGSARSRLLSDIVTGGTCGAARVQREADYPAAQRVIAIQAVSPHESALQLA